MYVKTKVLHLAKFNFWSLEQKIVKEGGISQEVFEKYLHEKGMTWGDEKSLLEIEREKRRKEIFEKYPPKID
jgi:hypothetical protein